MGVARLAMVAVDEETFSIVKFYGSSPLERRQLEFSGSPTPLGGNINNDRSFRGVYVLNDTAEVKLVCGKRWKGIRQEAGKYDGGAGK